MASNSVSVLKFVGTVSLGLLTGLSYTLSTLTVPTLLTLPSASTASRAFKSLTTTAETHLRSLTSVSGSAFFLAYLLSPRPFRHPYLLYTSILVLGSQFATSEFVAPYLYLNPREAQPSSSASAAATAAAKERKERVARARMEASYEVLGSGGSDAHSDGTVSGEEVEVEERNGEEVRFEVENFLKKQMVQTSVAGLGFLLSIVGIWGDGANGADFVIRA